MTHIESRNEHITFDYKDLTIVCPLILQGPTTLQGLTTIQGSAIFLGSTQQPGYIEKSGLFTSNGANPQTLAVLNTVVGSCTMVEESYTGYRISTNTPFAQRALTKIANVGGVVTVTQSFGNQFSTAIVGAGAAYNVAGVVVTIQLTQPDTMRWSWGLKVYSYPLYPVTI